MQERKQLVIELKSSYSVQGCTQGGIFDKIILCGDIRTEMVEHEICLLTWALSRKKRMC